METIGARIESLDWRGVAASLDAQGFAELPAMLDQLGVAEVDVQAGKAYALGGLLDVPEVFHQGR